MLIEKFEKINNFILKYIFIILFLLILLYLFGNNNTPTPIFSNSPEYQNTNNFARNSPMMLSAKANVSYDNSSKMIQNFGLSIEMKNTENVSVNVESYLKEINGFIENFYSFNFEENELAYNYVLKIPTNSIPSAILHFKMLGIVKSESSSALNATEQYSDNANKLKNLYLRRNRLRKMMENKTEKLADIIAVDRELNNVQNEIETLESRNQEIDKNVSYSKLDLSILPERKITNFNNNHWNVENSWKKAVNGLIIFGQQSINYSFKFIVFIPILIIAYLIYKLGSFTIKKIKK